MPSRIVDLAYVDDSEHIFHLDSELENLAKRHHGYCESAGSSLGQWGNLRDMQFRFRHSNDRASFLRALRTQFPAGTFVYGLDE